VKREWDKSKTTRVPPSFCPFCFYQMDAVSSVGSEAVPEPGDFTVCIDCCKVLQFDANMQLCAASLLDIPMHSRMDFAKVVTKCEQMKAKRPKRRPM
jgi:hypothetical protein